VQYEVEDQRFVQIGANELLQARVARIAAQFAFRQVFQVNTDFAVDVQDFLADEQGRCHGAQTEQ
jgi:hypothetical protein